MVFLLQHVLVIAATLSMRYEVDAEAPKYFNVGLMFPISTTDYQVSPGVKFMAAMEMAIDEINNKSDGIYDGLLPLTELRMVVRSPSKSFALGALAATEMMGIDNGKGVIACAGPAVLEAMKGSNPVFGETGNIPQIGYMERGAVLGESRAFPNHLRTVPGLYRDGKVVVELLHTFFKWNKVTLFSTTDDYGSQTSFLFKNEASKHGVDILSSHAFLVNKADLSNEIRGAKRAGARVFVLLMNPSNAYNLLKQGHDEGLFTRNTQIIGGGLLSAAADWTAAGLPNGKVSRYLSGFIGVSWSDRVFPSEQVTAFIERWRARENTNGKVQPDGSVVCDDRMDSYNEVYLHRFQPYENASAAPVCAGVNFSSYGDDGSDLLEEMHAYDAVVAIALTLHNITYVEGVCDPPASKVLNYLQHSLYFEGLSGNISFSTEYENQLFDVGGRYTSLLYDIVNYVSASSTLDAQGEVVFRRVTEWHSELGFPHCRGRPVYNEVCHDFSFSTKDNSLVHDSPDPEFMELYPYYRVILRLFAAGCLAMLSIVVIVVSLFRHRRICRMAQPGMILMICTGLILGCVRVVLASVDLTTATCMAEFWTAHLGFVIVITALGIKSWRVYLVTSAMKKVKVSETKCIVIVLSVVLVATVTMIAHSIFGDIHVSEVTIVQDQFEHIRELKCLYGNLDALYALNAVEIVLILFAFRMLWQTRHVASTISSTGASASAVVSICSAIVVMYIFLELVDLEPLVRQFVIAIVLVTLCIRVTWILYSTLVINVLMGYDLDKALQQKKMAWSILSVGLFRNAAKVIGYEPDDTLSVKSSFTGSNEDATYVKALAKFSKSKNEAELQQEIDKIKNEIVDRQAELACLENMKFASSDSGNSSSSNSRPLNESIIPPVADEPAA